MSDYITDARMAAYWERRVRALEAMRPIMPAEAHAAAARERKAASAYRDGIADARKRETDDAERGRVAAMDTLYARGTREAKRIGVLRESVWGDETRACQCEGRADAYERITSESVGQALAESLAEARRRATYYRELERAALTKVEVAR